MTLDFRYFQLVLWDRYYLLLLLNLWVQMVLEFRFLRLVQLVPEFRLNRSDLSGLNYRLNRLRLLVLLDRMTLDFRYFLLGLWDLNFQLIQYFQSDLLDHYFQHFLLRLLVRLDRLYRPIQFHRLVHLIPQNL